MDSLTSIAPRRLEVLVPRLMADEPVVVLAGARTVGKSTLLRRLAGPSAAAVLDLDDLTTRGLVRDDLAFYAGGRHRYWSTSSSTFPNCWTRSRRSSTPTRVLADSC